MTVQQRINVGSLLTAGLALLFSFFVYTSNRWVENVEAQISQNTADHRALDSRVAIVEAHYDEISRGIRTINDKLDRR